MKKSFLILIITCFVFNASAQQKLPSSEQVNTFLSSKTYFVLDNNLFGLWNNAIKEAADKYWNITEYAFINPDEYRKKRNSPSASFIMLTDSYFEGQEDMGIFTSISVLLGQKSATINSMPDIAEFPLSYQDTDYDEYYYKLGIALEFIQNHIIWLKENPNSADMIVFNHYKNTKENTKEKTLYLQKKELAPNVNTLEYIKKVYSGNVKLVSQEEIEEAINNKDENVILLHLVGPAKDVDGLLALKMLLGAADGKLYYFDYHKVKKGKKPGVFLLDDFKQINK